MQGTQRPRQGSAAAAEVRALQPAGQGPGQQQQEVDLRRCGRAEEDSGQSGQRQSRAALQCKIGEIRV